MLSLLALATAMGEVLHLPKEEPLPLQLRASHGEEMCHQNAVVPSKWGGGGTHESHLNKTPTGPGKGLGQTQLHVVCLWHLTAQLAA